MVVQVFYILVLKKTVATWGLTSKMSSASATTTSHLVGHATNLWSFLRCSGCIHPPFFSDFISVWLCRTTRLFGKSFPIPYHTSDCTAYICISLFDSICLCVRVDRHWTFFLASFEWSTSRFLQFPPGTLALETTSKCDLSSGPRSPGSGGNLTSTETRPRDILPWNPNNLHFAWLDPH